VEEQEEQEEQMEPEKPEAEQLCSPPGSWVPHARPARAVSLRGSRDSQCAFCRRVGATNELFTKHRKEPRHLRLCDNCDNQSLKLLAPGALTRRAETGLKLPIASPRAMAPLVSEKYEDSLRLRAGGDLVPAMEGVVAAAYDRWQRVTPTDSGWFETFLTKALYDAFGRAKGDAQDAVPGRTASRSSPYEASVTVPPSFLARLLPRGSFFLPEFVRPTFDLSSRAPTTLQVGLSSLSRLVKVLGWSRVVHRRPSNKKDFVKDLALTTLGTI
jgi:hypothetical protein